MDRSAKQWDNNNKIDKPGKKGMRYMDKKKKWTRILPVLLTLMLCCSACSDEDYVLSESRAVTFVPTHAAPASGTTRVNKDNEWTGKETFGICMYSGTSLATTDKFYNYIPNSGISYPTSNGITLDPATSDDTLYFPSNGDSRKFIAFGPVKSVTNSRVTYDLSSQSTEAAMEKADFIYSAPTKSYTKDNASVNLEFKHKLSRIVINVTNGDNNNSKFPALENLKLKKMHTSVTMDLSNGSQYTRSVVGDGIITPYKTLPTGSIGATTPKVTYQAIVATGETNTMAVIDFGGITEYEINGHTFKAGESYVFDFALKGNDVTLEKTTIIDWTGGTVAWNWQYYLQVAKSELTHYNEGTQNNTVAINTDYKETPRATVIPADNWIWNCTVTPEGGKAYKLTYNVSANYTGYSRTGKITITAGELSVEIKVNQNNKNDIIIHGAEMTNCYMVPRGGTTLYIPAASIVEEYHNTYDTEHPKIEVGVNYIPILLWSDVAVDGAPTNSNISQSYVLADNAAISALSYDATNRTIKVNTGNKEGNAVIGLLNTSTSHLFWSWHIWVTDYNPAGAKNMNRNLGAMGSGSSSTSSFGLYYQYGRKDPFLEMDDKAWFRTDNNQNTYTYSKIMTKPGPVSTTIAISSPSYFASGAGYWSTHMESAKWSKENGDATIFDPCPSGYRVNYDYSDLEASGDRDEFGVNTSYGYFLYNDMIDWENGQYYSNGESVAIWCSTYENGYPQATWITRGKQTTTYNEAAAGLQVRCSKE